MTLWSYDLAVTTYNCDEEVSTLPTQTFLNLPDEKREKILTIALEEFAQNPYTKASISRIVEKAQIAKGSIYQYFEDKKDLYLYLIELAGRVKLEFVAGRQGYISWEDFYKGLESLILVSTEFQFKNPLHAKLLLSAMESELKDETFARMKKMSFDVIADLISNGQQSGQIRKDIPIDVITYFVNSLMTGLGEYMAMRAGMDLSDFTVELERWSREIGPSRSTRPDGHIDLLGIDFTELVHQLVTLIREALAPQ